MSNEAGSDGRKDGFHLDIRLAKHPTPWHKGSSTKVEIVDASTPALETMTPGELDGKCIAGIMIHLKHGSSSRVKMYERSNYGNLWGPIASKRQKREAAATYDRLAMFLDISRKDGKCFCMILQSHHESRIILKNYGGSIAVGMPVFIPEPVMSDAMIGETMPIIKTTWPLVPIQLPNDMSLADVGITRKMTAPSSVGEHRAFLFHNKIIRIDGFKLVHDSVSCSGRFCDRAGVLRHGESCGCITHSYSKKPAVGMFHVSMLVPHMELKDEIVEAHVTEFRSLRTTEYFFKDLNDFSSLEGNDIDDATHEVRKRVNTMVDFINDKGGWTIVGWFRKGELQDASTTEEKVLSAKVTFHLSLLVPTDAELLHGNNQDYNPLRITKQIIEE